MKIKCSICKESCEDCIRYQTKNLTEKLRLTKKKVSTHYIPPDMNALKLLHENKNYNYQSLSDKELAEMKKRALLELKEFISK